jgi:hypothetical protein
VGGVSSIDPDRYRYRASDLQRVHASEVRVGDLLAVAGPPGSGLYAANPVTHTARMAGTATGDEAVYRICVAAPGGEICYRQPQWLPMRRVVA